MGTLSRGLANYLNTARARGEVGEATPIRLVVKLRGAPTATISRVARTARGRATAFSALRHVAAGAALPALESVQPRRLIEGVATVTVDVASREVEALAALNDVEYVRAVRMHRQHLDVSTPLLWVDASVRSRFRGDGITVAVLDSGIDADHPDLQGRVLKSKSRNFTSEGGQNDTGDGNGHGTHVAGIIGGAGGKYRGVAPEVRFIACKVFDAQGNGEEGALIEAVRWAVAQGADVINYSGGYAPIVNSPVFGQIVLVQPPWVWPIEPLQEEAEFIAAMDGGVVSVVSAGNEGEIGRRGTLSMPATAHQVISVGAVDKQRQLSKFSSVGPAFRSAAVTPEDVPLHLSDALAAQTFPEVDLIAPGGEVDPLSAQAGGCFYSPGIVSAKSTAAPDDPDCAVKPHYRRLSGTSQAAPHIAGLAALTLEAAASLGVNLGDRRAYAVKGILKRASGRLPTYTLHEQGSGLPQWQDVEATLRAILDGSLDVASL